MSHPFLMTACALAATLAMSGAHAQEASAETTQTAKDGTTLEKIVVAGKRANRVSKGATGLPMAIKDTPQSISTIDQEEISDFGVTGANDALGLATGINVEKWETNRVTYNARGFDIQLTQVDGLGMTNAWGTVVGNEDTFLFERIELIRGANGLLTGVGNSSGTINYVRKRPLNEDRTQFVVTAGSESLKRAAVDVNKVLTQDGSWAGRFVVAHEDKESHIRDVQDKRTTLYGVVDGQIGRDGVLTLGLTASDTKQDAPMWGSLTLARTDGTQADFPRGSSTSQNWTYWDTKSYTGFVEYAHRLSDNWEAKGTYTYRHGNEATQLFYAWAPAGMNPDNTGLQGQAYKSVGGSENHVADVNVTGKFFALGHEHSLIAGLSQSRQKTRVDTYSATPLYTQLPAFPYDGDIVAEPAWGPRSPSTRGSQKLTRFYAATRLAVTDSLKAIVGVNSFKLERDGASIYGNAASNTIYPDTKETSPYLGLTYDFTKDILGYVSYSDIFQNQDQTDINGEYLAPMKGVNTELGVKAEWLNKSLLTTAAVFTSKQKNLGTYVGMIDAPGSPLNGQYYYEGRDVKSKGFEFEATGRLGRDANITLGYTRLIITDFAGDDTREWVPRHVVNFRVDSRVPMLPALRLGAGGRWQSENSKIGAASQGAFVVANVFAAYEVTKSATVRLNVNNLFDKKYIEGISTGAIYSAPRNVALTLDYKL